MVGAPSHGGPPVCLHFEKTPQRGNTGGSIGQEKVPSFESPLIGQFPIPTPIINMLGWESFCSFVLLDMKQKLSGI
jgi:hypothetical protein